MASPEFSKIEGKPNNGQMPLGDPAQEAILNQALVSPSVRRLIGDDAVKVYVESLAELGCSPGDIQRNSEKLRCVGVKKQLAAAYAARVGAASINGNGKGRI